MHIPSRSLMLATTFGLGYLRPASGTWGSIPPVLLAAAMLAVGLGPGDAPIVYAIVMAAVLVVFSGACIAAADEAEARFARKDPSQVVADETAGMALTLLLLPAVSFATPATAAVTLTLAFLAFRAMDILKPWPADSLQRLPGGWGILLDDLVAAVYAAAIVNLAVVFAL